MCLGRSKTRGIRDDEIKTLIFVAGLIEPVEHIGFLQDMRLVTGNIRVDFVMLLDEIEGVFVSIETPDLGRATQSGID